MGVLHAFSSVFAVDLEQLNVCWVPSYQYINAEIIYCRNYWQMHKNLSEIEIHKKRVWSKVIVPKKCLELFAGNSFFLGYSVFYFTNVASAIHSSMDTVLFRRALPAINCVYTMYLTGIWKVLKGIWQVFERYWVNLHFQLQSPIRWVILSLL